MSKATTESEVSAAGAVYAFPVAAYTAPRFRSTVGADQIAAPAGAQSRVPCEFVPLGLGSSGIV